MHELKPQPGRWPLGTKLSLEGHSGAWRLVVDAPLVEEVNLPLLSATYATLQDLAYALYNDEPALVLEAPGTSLALRGPGPATGSHRCQSLNSPMASSAGTERARASGACS